PLAAIPTGAELSAVGGELVESWNDVQERLNDAGAGALTLSFVDGQEVTLQLPSSATERLQVIDHINFFAEPVIGGVETGSAADVAGIQEGDRILRAADESVNSWTEFVDIIRAHPG